MLVSVELTSKVCTKVCGFPAAGLRAATKGRRGALLLCEDSETYAVKWREPDGQTFIGRLALGALQLRLEGRRRGADGPAVRRQFAYEELLGLRIGTGRRPARRTPRARRRAAEGATSSPGAGMGAPIVQELVERLAVLVGPQEDLRLTRSRCVLRPG